RKQLSSGSGSELLAAELCVDSYGERRTLERTLDRRESPATRLHGISADPCAGVYVWLRSRIQLRASPGISHRIAGHCIWDRHAAPANLWLQSHRSEYLYSSTPVLKLDSYAPNIIGAEVSPRWRSPQMTTPTPSSDSAAASTRIGNFVRAIQSRWSNYCNRSAASLLRPSLPISAQAQKCSASSFYNMAIPFSRSSPTAPCALPASSCARNIPN